MNSKSVATLIVLFAVSAFCLPIAVDAAAPPPGMAVWLDSDTGLSTFNPGGGNIGWGNDSTRIRWVDQSVNGHVFETGGTGAWGLSSIAAVQLNGHDNAYHNGGNYFVSTDGTGTGATTGAVAGSTSFDASSTVSLFMVMGASATSGNRGMFAHGSNYEAFDFVFAGGNSHQTSISGVGTTWDGFNSIPNNLYDGNPANTANYEPLLVGGNIAGGTGFNIREIHITDTTAQGYTDGVLEGGVTLTTTGDWLTGGAGGALYLGANGGGANGNGFGAFAEILLYTAAVDRTAVYDYLFNKFFVEAAAVPEPNAFALGFIALSGFGLLTWRRRKRRKE